MTLCRGKPSPTSPPPLCTQAALCDCAPTHHHPTLRLKQAGPQCRPAVALAESHHADELVTWCRPFPPALRRGLQGAPSWV